MYTQVNKKLYVEKDIDQFSQAVSMAGDNAVTAEATCFYYSIDHGDEVELKITLEGSDDLQNWEDLSGATASQFISFTDLGYDELAVSGIAHQYVRLKFSWVWASEPDEAAGIVAAGINTANV